ncbi:MAG: hypothetical protein GF320_03445 [Armatimonadia bacterium]|nr:hypothetical protein [Armatimonadia bacterium]
MGDRFYAMGLPYAGEEADVAASALRAYMRGHVLDETNYVSRRGVLLLEGPGIGSWGRLGDAGKFSTNVLETLWWYAHNTGDWSLIEDRWPTIERLFVMPLEVRFHTFGRGEIAEMGDEAAPPLCYARMAWRVGDRDEYARGCSLFVREMAHLWLKFRGAELFREHWPVSSMEPYGDEIYLTNLWGDTAGWQIDGPEYPEETGERQYNNRWVRFSHPDVARALRDLLGDEVQEEIDLLTRRDDFYGVRRPVAHITPSIERLRSLLLDETDEELAELSPPGTWPAGRYADQIAYYLAFIWGARAGTETERVVPRDGQPGRWGTRVPWWPDEDPALVVQLTADPDLPHGDPTLSWHGWSPPQQAEGYPRSGHFSFGQIRADGE